ncbi:MAG: metallophosphoesterase [Thermodesulfobacteriota bacterium]
MSERSRTVRVAAAGDLHCTRASKGRIEPLLARMAERADILCLCGDLTDYGLREEAIVLAAELATVGKKPVLCVLGNHDYESGQVEQVHEVLSEAGAVLLCGESYETHGVGFAGTKGFCGGFGRFALEPWGETPLKAFVQEALDEALKLEKALSRLRAEQRIALLHYAPIVETVEGEPAELFPFLGSSRLEEPINRFPVAAVFHGHAHAGSLEGKTSKDIPVYNVSVPAFQRRCPGEDEFRVVELAVAG